MNDKLLACSILDGSLFTRFQIKYIYSLPIYVNTPFPSFLIKTFYSRDLLHVEGNSCAIKLIKI